MESLVARLPFSGPDLAERLRAAHSVPSGPVRAMRRGLNAAYGAAGAGTGLGLGVLRGTRRLFGRETAK